jgi:hypothetical protein
LRCGKSYGLIQQRLFDRRVYGFRHWSKYIYGVAGVEIQPGQVVMRGEDGKFYPTDRGHPGEVSIETIKKGQPIVRDGNFVWPIIAG